VVLPLPQWSKISKHALCAALAISNEVEALFVVREEISEELCHTWRMNVEEPARAAGITVPQLVVLKSPYRFVVNPIIDYVLELSRKHPNRRVILMVAELVEGRWYNYLLQSHRATLLKTQLLVKGNNQISVLNVPWYLR
jgi:hypothetical protein